MLFHFLVSPNLDSNTNNDRNNATFNDNNDGQAEAEEEEEERNKNAGPAAGGNAIKELIATSGVVVPTGRNETPITTTSTGGGNEDEGHNYTATALAPVAAVHPTSPVMAQMPASCREGQLDEDVGGWSVASKGTIDDASLSKGNTQLST